jgi:hypothetical protein
MKRKGHKRDRMAQREYEATMADLGGESKPKGITKNEIKKTRRRARRISN